MSTSFSRRERTKRGAERAAKHRLTVAQCERCARRTHAFSRCFLAARPFFPRPESQFRAGFNTITLTDCCATTSAEGHRGATEGTFGMFSSPMTGEEFLKKINA